MSKKDEKEKAKVQEELRLTLPDEAGGNREPKSEEQEAMDAIRKFTDEDEDEKGEISVKSILGGDFLMSKFMMKQVAFVMFCVLLMICYTGNRYDSQQDAILIDSLRGRLQEVKYNVLTQSSELMNLTRQSNVEKMLNGTKDSLLHNSILPPYLIKANGRKSMVRVDIPEEVGVEDVEEHAEGTRQEQTEDAIQEQAEETAQEKENQELDTRDSQ